MRLAKTSKQTHQIIRQSLNTDASFFAERDPRLRCPSVQRFVPRRSTKLVRGHLDAVALDIFGVQSRVVFCHKERVDVHVSKVRADDRVLIPQYDVGIAIVTAIEVVARSRRHWKVKGDESIRRVSSCARCSNAEEHKLRTMSDDMHLHAAPSEDVELNFEPGSISKVAQGG